MATITFDHWFGAAPIGRVPGQVEQFGNSPQLPSQLLPLVTGDRVKETTTTMGTGTVTLDGAVSGFQAFSVIAATGAMVAYGIIGGTEWEVGIGSWYTGNLLQRDQVLASSNAGSLVSFSAGTKDVFCTMPAAYGLMPLAKQTQVTDVLVPSKSSTYINDQYDLTAGKAVELGSGAAMEIG